MKNDAILYGIIGLLLGVVITGFLASNAVSSNNMNMMRMMGMNTDMMRGEIMDEGMDKMHGMMGDSMSGMVEELKGKSGDEFDKAFISEMIIHHQGAIDMAQEAKKSAKHQEIKGMADDIIEAQSKEIEIMKSWQKEWGY